MERTEPVPVWIGSIQARSGGVSCPFEWLGERADMANRNSSRAVITVHGIRTRGVWQKEFAPELALAGFIPYALDFGHLQALRLLWPLTLDKQVEWLMREYDRVRLDSNCESPSVVAHSFGTLQVATLLQKHKEVNFDTVIFAAGIVPTDFRWTELLDNARVRWAVNEYGEKDVWAKVARILPHAGHAGAKGFTEEHKFLHQIRNPLHRHSDYFAKSHFRYNWLPTLLLNKRQIIEDLQYMLAELQRAYGIRANSLRCSVFAEQLPSDRGLKVISGLQVGTFFPGEDEIVIEFDKLGPRGAPALAFTSTREIKHGGDDIETLKSYDRTVHPKLKWSVGIPIHTEWDTKTAVGALLLEGLDDTDRFLPDPLMNDKTVFDVLVRTGNALNELSFLR